MRGFIVLACLGLSGGASPFLAGARLEVAETKASSPPSLAPRLQRAQSLPLEDLRQLQAEVAQAAENPSKSYQDAYLNYLLITHLKKSDPRAGKDLLGRTLQELEARTDPESLALRGGCLGLKIGFQPLLAPVLSARANYFFNQALKAAPGSPRVRWFQAVHTLGSPGFLGGGAKAARPLLEAALVAAEAEPDSPDALAPRWGKTEVLTWLSFAQAKTGDRPLALVTVRRALSLAPDHPVAKQIESQLVKLEKAP